MENTLLSTRGFVVADEALRESEARYRSVVAVLDEGILIFNSDGVVETANESAARILGVPPNALVGWSARAAHHDNGTTSRTESLRQFVALATDEPQTGVVLAIERPDATRMWTSINTRPLFHHGELTPYAVVMSFTDITERMHIEGQLRHAAHHDPLTALPNRALLMDRLARHSARARRRKQYHFALLFLDLDHFKAINDTLGHSAGDHLLAAVAERLRQVVRPDDTIARIGGDEFALIVGDVAEPADVIGIATRIQAAVAVPLVFKRTLLSMSVSIGIALCGAEHERPEDALRHADAAMYRAKSQGRGRFAVADAGLRREIARQTQLETDFARAVPHANLEITEEPVITLATGEFAARALDVVWRHPACGPIARDELYAMADAGNARADLDRWVVRAACGVVRQRNITGDHACGMRVSIPLSGPSLLRPTFLSDFAALLAAEGVAPDSFTIRITEEGIVEESEAAIAALHRLRALGVRLQLDHFGVGRSIMFLRRFPLDAIQVDRSFSATIEDEADARVVGALVTLARTMQMDVVADGIETDRQRTIFTTLGCVQGQGPYFSRATLGSGLPLAAGMD